MCMHTSLPCDSCSMAHNMSQANPPMQSRQLDEAGYLDHVSEYEVRPLIAVVA